MKDMGEFERGERRDGLSEAQVLESRAKYGSNGFTERKRKGFLSALMGGFGDPMIRILLCALGLTLLLPDGEGGIFDAVGIAVAVTVSVFVSALCEYGSERAFITMQKAAASQGCRVIRDGVERTVPIAELVVGDEVLLRAGERIPADGRLIRGEISCDLSALNGESAEQRKTADTDFSRETSLEELRRRLGELSDRESLFRGSEITSGEGVMVVCAVGDATYYGRVATELQTEAMESPLKRKLSKLAKTLSKIGYFCAFAVAVSNFLFNTVFDSEFVFSFSGVLSALLSSLTLAVSVTVMAVPEGLPMMITVVLASNMIKMKKQNVVVRKPVGIETAGSINVLFTDKTGTLTYGRPTLCGFVAADGVLRGPEQLSEPMADMLGLVSAYAVGTAYSHRSEKKISAGSGATGSEGFSKRARRKRGCKETEGAINVTAGSGEAADRALSDAFFEGRKFPYGATRAAYLPFNSNDKLCAATVMTDPLSISAGIFGEKVTLIKGAPEILLERCEYAYGESGEKREIDRSALYERLRSIASSGMRVLAAVSSSCDGEAVEEAAVAVSRGERADLSRLLKDAVFISFICVRDSLRAEAPEAIACLQGAGIQTVMITGDNPFTAEAIAREAGILPRGETPEGAVLMGAELAAMSDSEVKRRIPRLRVVARALPQDKSRLVRLASSLGMVVGMTGDGLNDAPALKQADVGFAMGSGTDVAKEAGDLVIADDNIATIVKAVHFGRTVFRSIRKFIVFQLTMNLCAVGISVAGPFIGYESPISVIQMLWINIIIDTLAAIAFAGEAPLKEYMLADPIPGDASVLSADMVTKIFTLGTYTFMLSLYFLISPRTAALFSGDPLRILTGSFALFIFSGLIGSLNARAEGATFFSGIGMNPVFLLVMSGVFTAQVGMIYYGGGIFDTVPLGIGELGYVFILALTVLPVGALYEFLRNFGRGPNSVRLRRAIYMICAILPMALIWALRG